jgi:hypothetical protein
VKTADVAEQLVEHVVEPVLLREPQRQMMKDACSGWLLGWRKGGRLRPTEEFMPDLALAFTTTPCVCFQKSRPPCAVLAVCFPISEFWHMSFG